MVCNGIKKFLIFVLFFVTFNSWSQNAKNAADLNGVVIDSVTGKPVAGALIMTGARLFSKEKSRTFFTNAEGKFSINEITSGEQKLTIYASGVGGTVRSFTMPDSSLSPVIIKLSDGGQNENGSGDKNVFFAGVVADSSSNIPISNAQILFDSTNLVTDDNGVFVIKSGSEIKGRLTIKAAGYFDTSQILLETSGKKFSTAVILLKRDIMSSSGFLQGRIKDSTESIPIRNAAVIDLLSGVAFHSDTTGLFLSKPLPPGSRSFMISKEGYTNKIIRNVNITAKDTIFLNDIHLVKKPDSFGIKICITITDENNKGIAGATISPQDDSTSFLSDSTGNTCFQYRKHGMLAIRAHADGFDSTDRELMVMKTDTAAGMIIRLSSKNELNDTTNGIISGTVLDKYTQSLAADVWVEVEDRLFRAKTDKLGKFTIKGVAPGGYALYINSDKFYQSSIPYIIVDQAQKSDVIIYVERKDVAELQKAFITGKKSKRSTAGLLQERKERQVIGDQLGADMMQKSAAGNAAEAMRYIPGLTIVDDKYVVIRGLSDRFVANRFEGVEIPSPNPDRVAFNYNLFPSGVLDNIDVVKTYTSNIPGNFSGGLVDVRTKEIPANLTFGLSGSVSGNTHVTFQEILAEKGGRLDWLGFDDGTRATPDEVNDVNNPIPRFGDWRTVVPQNDSLLIWKTVQRYDEVAKCFNTQFVPHIEKAMPEAGASLSVGKSVNWLERKFGLLLAANYSNSVKSYNSGTQNNWEKSDADEQFVDSLTKKAEYNDSKTTKEYSWIGMVKSEARLLNNNVIDLYYLYTRNAEDMCRYAWSQFLRYREIKNGRYEQREIKFTQRGLSFLLLKGDHPITSNQRIVWNANYSSAIQDEPDYRVVMDFKQKVAEGDSILIIRTASGVLPSHSFRTTTEKSKLFTVEHSFKQSVFNDFVNIDFAEGLFFVDRRRAFDQRRFKYDESGKSKPPEKYGTDLDAWLGPENLGLLYIDSTKQGSARYIAGNGIILDTKEDTSVSHVGSQTHWALYGKTNLKIGSGITLSGGLRYEPVEVSIKSRNPDSVYNGGFRKDLLLYSAGVNYSISENMITRFSYSHTVNLPSYREIAPYQSIDPVTLRNEMGNPNLKLSQVKNVDLRWEWFYAPSQIIAATLFFKHIDDPIDKLPNPSSINGLLQPQNNDSAKLYGCEIEGSLQLGTLFPAIESWSVGGNLTLLKTTVFLNDTIATLLRRNTAERPLPYSSPYIINFNVQYDNQDKGLNIAAFFNILGPRLVYASSSQMPDCYEFPRPILNITASKKVNRFTSAKLVIKNVLNTRYRDGYTYKGKRYYNQVYNSGIRLQLSISMSLSELWNKTYMQ